MATVTELKARIKRRLSRKTGTVLDADIIDELTHAQSEILEKMPTLPKFLLADSQTLNIVGTHSFIAISGLSPAFLRPAALYYKNVDVTQGFDGVRIKRFDDIDQLNGLHSGEATTPKGYYWDGSTTGKLQLRPYVTVSLTYYPWYYRADLNTPSSPDANDETLWTKHAGDLLLHTAGVEIAQYLRDQTALQYFSAKRQEAHTRFIKQITADEMGDQELVMGE